jgi:hypothetical protein
VRRTKNGRNVWGRANRFWKLPAPVAITSMNLPSRFKKDVPVAFLGLAPTITVADGDEKTFTKKKNVRMPKGSMLVTDHTGKRFAIVNPRGIPQTPKLKRLGFAAATEYMAPKSIQKTNSPKAKDYLKRQILWRHEHSEEGGKWPEVFQDQNGNVAYRGGTAEIRGMWMRK